MEEENRKGPGLFYAVVSIATLVVAIIGATFAYFSATVNATDSEPVTGKTFDISGEETSVTLKVEKQTFAGAQAGSLDLVPAKLGDKVATEVTEKEINGALDANCEEKGYTGCHLWKVTVTNGSTLANVAIKMDLDVEATDKTVWSYAFFTATGEAAGPELTVASADDISSKGAFAKGITAKSENNLDEGTHVYYLMVYLYNNGSQQDNSDASDATGTYTGTVTLEVASGGEISASFAAAV